MRKIVYLPLDERPCNYDFPYFALEHSDSVSIVRPPLELMGKKKTPADSDELADFIVRECRDADYLILALDTLLYGGIIPSRLHHLDIELLKERLGALRKIRLANPNVRISAFSLIMRCPCYSDSSEEPDYYATCGREIFLYGQNEHKHRLGEITDAEYEAHKRELSACFDYISDYESRRKVNLSLLLDALSMVGEYIDGFTILQDDSNARGYTAMDREVVLNVVKERGIDLDTYPGADEAGMTLLSRAVTYLEGVTPKIYVEYPRVDASDVTPIYEDRAIKHTVSAQIQSAGALECFNAEEADFTLFINLNDERTYDVYLAPTKQTDESYIPDFTSRIADALTLGRGAAVADVAYCNAGDLTFVRELAGKTDVLGLWGYAGWNTSSNTLGTVICQAVLRSIYGDTATHRGFTARRLIDDVVYSAELRPKVKNEYFGREGDTDLARMAEMINESTIEMLPTVAEKYEVVECTLPWNRLFEIGISIKEK